MNPSKNYRFDFWRNQNIFLTGKFLEDELHGTKHINKRWYILAKQLNLDLTWIFHTKKCILACFLLFSCLFLNILEKIPVCLQNLTKRPFWSPCYFVQTQVPRFGALILEGFVMSYR